MGCCHSSAVPSGRASQYAASNGATAVAGPDKMGFATIADNYSNLEQVQEALRKAGLESSNIIVAVDFTKSNEWAGKHSFNNKNLHDLGPVPNPYEQAITAIGKTLAAFDDDDLIPAYGFGDATTKDSHCFSFLAGDQPCEGLEQVLDVYRRLVPTVKLAGPTSFAPVINHAARIVAQSGGQYHILVLVADGQVTRSSDMPAGRHSEQEEATIRAIVDASRLPLSIVMVGVGDGPWDLMEEFDDKLPARAFDNFQFVNFTEVASRHPPGPRREAAFALRALMEIPEQFRAIQRLGLLGNKSARPPLCATPLNPPRPYQSASGRISGSNVPVPPAPPASVTCGVNAPAGDKASGSRNVSSSGAAAGGAGCRASGSGSASEAALQADERPENKPDPLFICPITQEVMNEPVMAADGFTYDRAALEQWLSSHRTSPMTNQRLAHTNLTPNHTLRSAIREWQDKQRLSASGAAAAAR